MSNVDKPLGGKAYGSIPHLIGSRRGPGDHGVHSGQHRICTEQVRDKHDIVICQEKLDGSNCSAARIGDEIVALTRAGYRAETSPYPQHHLFARWVAERADRIRDALMPGQRFVGEWLAQAHGTRYKLYHEPFVVFDVFDCKNVRFTYMEMLDRTAAAKLRSVWTFHRGNESMSIEGAMDFVGNGQHGAQDPVEGAVWTVERKGIVDFKAKFVRADKIDGGFLPGISAGPAIWNWLPA